MTRDFLKRLKLLMKLMNTHTHKHTYIYICMSIYALLQLQKGVKYGPHFFPTNCPILASQRPHLCRVTPLYFELPLENPVLCLLSICTKSSLFRFLIWLKSHRKNKNHRVINKIQSRKKFAHNILNVWTCIYLSLPVSYLPRNRSH